MAKKPPAKKTTKRPTKGREKGTGASYAAPTMKFATFGAGSLAYLPRDDPNYAPTPADTTVLLRKGGYTKIDGKLYKGTYAGVNNAPYLTGEGPVGWTGTKGPKTKLFTGPQGAASFASDPKLFKQYIKQAEALGYASRDYFMPEGGKKQAAKKGGKKDNPKGGKKGQGGKPKTEQAFGSAEGESKVVSPYAEADTSTTSYRRAQGKAYGKGVGAGLYGQTEVPGEDSAVVEDAAAGGGGKRKNRKKAKRLTTKAKTKKSPGGKKVTPKERARIQRAKGKRK